MLKTIFAGISNRTRDTFWSIESFSEMEIFCICYIINPFTVTFDEFNASLLNKSINLFYLVKSFLTPSYWITVFPQKNYISASIQIINVSWALIIIIEWAIIY